jgi:multidrug efflux system membrane fusion protein
MGRKRLFLIAVLVAVVGGFLLARVWAAPEKTGATTSTEQGASQKGQGSGGGGAIAVVTTLASTADVPETRDAVGWIEPIATVAVKSQIDGIIVEQQVTDGQMVKAGDVLFKLDDSTIRATIAKDQAALAKDQATLDEAKVELGRQQELLQKHVATQQQFDQQQATVKVQQATVAMDQAQLQVDQVQLNYTTIKAPISGRTGVVNITTGNLVHSSDTTPLVTITEMAPVRASFTVPERDLDRYRAVLAGPDPVQVQVSESNSDKVIATGKLSFIDSSVDTAAGAITLKANFDNTDGALWPGQYVKVRVRLGVNKNATVLPLVAIQQNNEGPFVFLVKPDRTVAITPVTLGTVQGDRTVVTSGINPGDHVVIEGQVRLSNGSAVRETLSPAAGSAGSS